MEDIDDIEFSLRFSEALGPWAPERSELLARHAWLVRERNRHLNLTRITDPTEMAVKHALDSLAAVPLLEGTEEAAFEHVVDLGTGAGWPGLALAIALPHLKVTLLDGTRKKIDFLKEVVDELELGDQVSCEWTRFEDWIRPRRHEVDAVLARAVGPLERLLNWCTNRWFGQLVLWKGPRFDDELAAAASLMEQRRSMVLMDQPYRLPGDDADRRLVVIGSI